MTGADLVAKIDTIINLQKTGNDAVSEKEALNLAMLTISELWDQIASIDENLKLIAFYARNHDERTSSP